MSLRIPGRLQGRFFRAFLGFFPLFGVAFNPGARPAPEKISASHPQPPLPQNSCTEPSVPGNSRPPPRSSSGILGAARFFVQPWSWFFFPPPPSFSSGVPGSRSRIPLPAAEPLNPNYLFRLLSFFLAFLGNARPGSQPFCVPCRNAFHDADVGDVPSPDGIGAASCRAPGSSRSGISAGRLRIKSQGRGFPAGSAGLDAGSWDLGGRNSGSGSTPR